MRRLALCFGLVIGGTSVVQAQWVATVLKPPGYYDVTGSGIGSSGAIGVGTASDGSPHALLWTLNSSSFVDLNPQGYSRSSGVAVAGDSQVGKGGFLDGTTVRDHALLWHGTASGAIDLHPSGWDYTVANGASEHSQVGQGTQTGSQENRALLWHGSAQSAIVLAPDGSPWSAAYAATDEYQVGIVEMNQNIRQAALWHGSKESYINLNPIWANESSRSEERRVGKEC